MKKTRHELTADRLRELFDYLDGSLIRKVGRGRGAPNRWKAGTPLGHAVDGRYVLCSIDGVSYKLHRLIWFWHKGKWPDGHIDHIDGNPGNNRIENMREATDAQNMQNIRRARATNKLGLVGVHVHNGRYRARMTIDGVSKHIGFFDTPEEAHNAYVEAKRRFHPFNTL